MTDDDRMRACALALLHRYASFDVQLRLPGWKRARSLEKLALLVWPSATPAAI
jgi:hypothetical protein